MNTGRYEAAFGAAFVGLSALLSVFFGHFFHFLLLFVLFALIYQIYQAKRLETWLRFGRISKYPETKGIWEGIYYQIYRIQKSDKRHKKRLGRMIKEFRSSTAALPYAAVVLGGHDEIEWFNKAAKQTLGLKKSDKGQRLPNLIRSPEFVKYLHNHKKTPVILPSPVDDKIILEFRIVEYGAGLRLLLAHDVTKIKKMEHMRKDFVANVSHELRTPLTVLKGYLETLQECDDGSNPFLSNSLSQMQGQTTRMEQLVDDLLLLTRLETQDKKTTCVDVASMLREICQETNNLHEAQGRVVLTLDTDTGLFGDERELRSAFTNLAINAVKYSPADSPVKIRWYKTRDALCLDVIDEGEGIAPQNIPRITERFYRVDVKRSQKLSGTGLGLAIVKHVMARHNAVLNIESSLGKGSCFSCIFKLELAC